MAGIYNGPSRGGTRGGKDQFNWDDAKEDKQLQNHLGHSVMAPKGRWQNGKDLTWYAKGSKTKTDLRAAEESERIAIKEREKDLMAQMLGEKPMEAPKSKLQKEEKNKLFKKGEAEEGTVAEGIEAEAFGERIEGLGYAPIKIDDLRQEMETTTSEKIEGTGINELLAAHAAGDAHDDLPHPPHHGGGDQDHAAMLAAIMGAGGGFGGGNEGGGGHKDKKAKKAEKKMKKAMKAEKKAEKKAKKESKGSKKDSKASKRRDSSSSPEPSSRVERESASSFFRKGRNEEGGREWDRGKVSSKDRQDKDSRGGGGGRRSRSRSGERRRDDRGRDRREGGRSRSRDRGDRGDRDRSRERHRDDSRERERRGRERS